jgi:hypothetical protein
MPNNFDLNCFVATRINSDKIRWDDNGYMDIGLSQVDSSTCRSTFCNAKFVMNNHY